MKIYEVMEAVKGLDMEISGRTTGDFTRVRLINEKIKINLEYDNEDDVWGMQVKTLTYGSWKERHYYHCYRKAHIEWLKEIIKGLE